MDFNVTLLSSGLPNFLPQTDRTEGWHVSSIITDMCLRLGYYSEEHAIDWTLVEAGNMFEWAAIQRRLLGSTEYTEIGEISLDDVYGHPDLLKTSIESVVEFKWTFRSSSPGCEVGYAPDPFTHPIAQPVSKFWKDRVQLMAYCRMIGWLNGELEIGYHRGNYRDKQLDHAVWGFQFTKRQLVDNWNMLLTQRDDYGCKHCQRFKHEKHSEKCPLWTPDNERWK
jgi:hypothetical protein